MNRIDFSNLNEAKFGLVSEILGPNLKLKWNCCERVHEAILRSAPPLGASPSFQI